MSSSDVYDDDWQQPSEAEMKILEKRRVRGDKISKLMGQYMLKGYKMLATSCPECGSILLQAKTGENYCVACQELDSDTQKDELDAQPDEHQSDTRAQPVPQVLQSFPRIITSNQVVTEILDLGHPHFHLNDSNAFRTNSATVCSSSANYLHNPAISAEVIYGDRKALCDTEVDAALKVVKKKLLVAATKLDNTERIDESIELCQLIKSCAECIVALNSTKV